MFRIDMDEKFLLSFDEIIALPPAHKRAAINSIRKKMLHSVMVEHMVCVEHDEVIAYLKELGFIDIKINWEVNHYGTLSWISLEEAKIPLHKFLEIPEIDLRDFTPGPNKDIIIDINDDSYDDVLEIISCWEYGFLTQNVRERLEFFEKDKYWIDYIEENGVNFELNYSPYI